MIAFYKKYKNVIKVILLLLVLAFVGQFVFLTDFNEIGKLLKKMPLIFVGILGASFLAYLCAALAWQLCLGAEHKKTSISQLFMMRHVGEMLSIFNPTSIVAGETLKAHYLNKQGISPENSISSILMSRILIVLSAILLLLLSTIYLIVNIYGAGENLILGILAAVLIGGFGYLLARFLLHSNLYFSKAMNKLQDKFGDKYITPKICQTVEDINKTCYRFYNENHSKFILAFVLSVVHWLLGAAEFYLILEALGYDCSVLNAVTIEMGVILFKTIGAVVPGQVGVEEYGNKVMLEMIGIAGNEVWVVVSIMRRARQLFWVVIAFIFYWLINRLNKSQELN
jgi:uncharacterized protein (TIRG00374 family)